MRTTTIMTPFCISRPSHSVYGDLHGVDAPTGIRRTAWLLQKSSRGRWAAGRCGLMWDHLARDPLRPLVVAEERPGTLCGGLDVVAVRGEAAPAPQAHRGLESLCCGCAASLTESAARLLCRPGAVGGGGSLVIGSSSTPLEPLEPSIRLSRGYRTEGA